MATVDEQVIVGGQRAVAVSEVSGDFLYDGGATDIQCIVKNCDNAQRAIKVVPVDGGGAPMYQKIIIKTNSMPTASSSTVGQMFIYSGSDTATYKHGFIYEGVSIPGDTKEVTFSPTTISATGADFWTFVKTVSPANYAEIVNGKMVYFSDADLWKFTGYNNNNEVVSTYQQYTQDYVDAGFTMPAAPSDGDTVYLECAINESSETVYTFRRIDVQPAQTGDFPGIAVDDELSLVSENPAQNKVITAALDGKVNDDGWKKPADWIDIRSCAALNSVYFLVAHSAPTGTAGAYTVATYPQFVVQPTISNSGTYDVFVDGNKIATTASETATTVDWAALYNNGTLVGGYDVTYPAALTTHVVRITPSVDTNTITAIPASTRPGTLWAHFTLTNEISLTGFGSSQTILDVITSESGEIKVTGVYNMCDGSSNRLKYIPVIDLTNGTRNGSGFLQSSGVRKVYIKNGILMQSTNTDVNNKLEEIITENASITYRQYAFKGMESLKYIPAGEFESSRSSYHDFLTNAVSLRDTFLDFSKATSVGKIGVYGSETKFISGLKGIIVSSSAPFTGSSPQINVSYTGLSRSALVNLFNSLPTVTGEQVCNITGCTGAADLTAEDLAIATSLGWTITR